MKNILIIICLFLATVTFSQTTDSTSCCKKEKTPITGYISYGLSMTNSSDFASSSYTGIEGGIMKGNLGLGVVFGRGSLLGLCKNGDNIRNYFYEAKMTGSFPIGNVNSSPPRRAPSPPCHHCSCRPPPRPGRARGGSRWPAGW